MAPHEERVVAEKKELDDRLKKLHDFVLGGNKNFHELKQRDKDLLRAQLQVMDRYSEILEERIARFSLPNLGF